MRIVQNPGDSVVHAALVRLELIENEFIIGCKISKESTSVGVGGVAMLETAASLTDQAICAASAAHLLSLSDFSALPVSGPESIIPALPRAKAQSQIQIWIQVFQSPN